MITTNGIQIEKFELRLKQAMLQSDLKELDKLLANDLLFTNHLGHIITKQDDIEAHKMGIIQITKLLLSDQQIRAYEDLVIVTVQAEITGIFNSIKSASMLRFTRVWKKQTNNSWQIIVGHSSLMV